MESVNENRQYSLRIEAEVCGAVNFALQQNGVRIVPEVVLYNDGTAASERMVLEISPELPVFPVFKTGIDSIPPGGRLCVRSPELTLSASYLAAQTERVSCTLEFRLLKADQEDSAPAAVLRREIAVLAFDEWQGVQSYPELAASFVLPNHPALNPILQRAAEYLAEWTGSGALDGYQKEDRNRVRYMAAAVYEALREEKFLYAVVPDGFEETGQRVRLPESIFQARMGNCLDLTLLFAGCLEAMGLHPLLIHQNGHVFAGVWLLEESFPEMVTEDVSLIEKRLSEGLREIALTECTMMTSGTGSRSTASFEDAEKAAVKELSDYGAFLHCVDIYRARRSRVRPLPLRVMTPDGWRVPEEETGNSSNRSVQGEGASIEGGAVSGYAAAPEAIAESFRFRDAREEEHVTKLLSWERKLLDLTTRNMLIHLRLTRSVVPLLSGSLGDLEDALADGAELRLMPRPRELDRPAGDAFTQENTNEIGPYEELIRSESHQGRLHTTLGERELEQVLVKLYRAAKASLEENGASTLFLSLGLLRWFESKDSDIPRYAPILLLPVEMVRKSASRGYILRARDDEPQLNITILELLKQEFGIHVQGLSPLPKDAHGLDMRKIFAAFRHAVLSEPRWNVIESGFLGNFSFSQFVMWNDIHNRAEFLSGSPVVKSLMEGALDPELYPDEWKESAGTVEVNGIAGGTGASGGTGTETSDLLLPLPADESQLTAIRMAAEGRSFVLHGPPGTGKSQTITALIANAIARGRTVLFVAEKMAALTVVEKRLNQLGLDPFCLELHSNRATRKSVLAQLEKALNTERTVSDGAWREKEREIRSLRAELDAYRSALHTRHGCGMTLREMLDLAEAFRSYPEFDLGFVDCDLETEKGLRDKEALVHELAAAGKGVGHPAGHPLRLVGQTRYSQALRTDLITLVNDYLGATARKAAAAEDYVSVSGLTPETAASLVVPDPSGIPGVLFAVKDPAPLFDDLSDYLRKEELVRGKEAELSALWSREFLALDMEPFRREHEEAGRKLLAPMRNRAYRLLLDKLRTYAAPGSGFPADTDISRIPLFLSAVTLYQQDKRALEEAYRALPGDRKALFREAQNTEQLEALRARFGAYREAVQKVPAFGGHLPERADIQKLREAREQLRAAESIEARAEEGILSLLRPWKWKTLTREEREQFLGTVTEHSGELKDWIVYQQAVERAAYEGLTAVTSRFEAGAPAEELYGSYLKSMYASLCRSAIEKDEALNSFTGVSFAEKIERFKRLDEEEMQLAKAELAARLSARLPGDLESKEVSAELGILRRAIRSGGRGLTIRSLFDQIPHVLKRLCPCMLMSPISVSQYLGPESSMADLVIFDEASQLPTCKACGVLARGRNAVIVGDPNQMPPTSFFAGSMIDEDNLEIEDLDSILDDCLALGMPETHLRWHYRSRHESLIAFSNASFYGNSMLTFPSGNDREKRVTLRRVDGFFDRGRTRQNRAEAEAIVEEIRKRYEDPGMRTQSVGVVTFNVNQQTLVEDLLQEQFRKDTGFDSWANDGEEPLFVKNLENVQGDERDVILFSTAFGPDQDGRMSMNFGPINQENGWKRLNVAVTRAKQEMVVFTIMRPEMISLTRTSARGVEALRDFLEFAETGRLPRRAEDAGNQTGAHAAAGGGTNGSILKSLAEAVGEAGYEYRTEVGHSMFRVDLAVCDPDHPEQYLLGVLLDADSYGKTIYTRDREVSEPSLLEGLGWKLHRVYAMDWWDDREREKERLLSKIAEVLEERREEERKAEEAREAEEALRAEEAREAEEVLRAEEAREAEEVLTAEEALSTEAVPPGMEETRDRADVPDEQVSQDEEDPRV